jgi:hypothetical protein
MSNYSAAITGSRALARGPANAFIVIAMLCAAVALALAAPAFRTGVFEAMSTDDAMRLTEVRDLIAGQGWFDLTQHRLDPPGTLMHWSRVVDAPLAALILLLRPLLGMQGAEATTLVLWPTLLFGASLVLVAAIAKRMSDGGNTHAVQPAAIILAALSVPALVHFRAGAIDHHNFQITLLLAFLLFASRIERSRVDAALAGIAATLSLAVGLEMLPAIATACVAIAGLLVWRGRIVSPQIFAFGATLAGSSMLLAAALLPPHSLPAPVCDAFSGPFLLLIAGGGVSLMITAAVDAWRSTMAARAAAAAASGLILLAAFFHLFPGCLASPYAAVDPLVASIWLDHVAETMSLQTLLQLEPQKIPGYFGFPALTLVLAVTTMFRSPPHCRFPLLIAAVTLAALIGISLWQMRGAAGATMVAAPIFAVSVAILWPACARGRKLLLLALLASPASFVGYGLAARPVIDRILKPHWTIAPEDAASSCRTVSSVAPLAALPRGRVMAPIDLGPALLAATEHSIFAAPYHRNNDGNLAMLRVMLGAPREAQQILRERQVDYIVLCRGSLEQVEFKRLAPDGLAAGLARGQIPDFLQPLGLDGAAKLAIWRVRRAGAAG